MNNDQDIPSQEVDYICSHCGEESMQCNYPLGLRFQCYDLARSSAKKYANDFGHDVHVEAAGEEWVLSIFDSCSYGLIKTLAPNAEYDPINWPHHYIGSPYYISASGLSLIEAAEATKRLPLDASQKCMIEPHNGAWRVMMSLTREQSETVNRLTSYFDGKEFYDRKYDEIEDYDTFVRTLAFAL